MNPIRVAILGTQGIPANYGGFETFAEELATRWAMDEAFQITVACPGPWKQGMPQALNRVLLEYVPAPDLGSFTTLAFDVRSLWRCRKFDVVYMLGYGAAFACWIPSLWGAKVWINMDGLEWKRSKWNLAARIYLRAMEWVAAHTGSRLIADADAIRAYLLAKFGKKISCTFIPYGAHIPPVGMATFAALPQGLTPGRYFLLVARLEPENQVAEIIQGFLMSEVTDPLVIVGGIQNPNAYVQDLLRHAGDRIMFLGGIYDKPLLAALRQHAIANIHGHTVGGTNPSLLEAIAAQRPMLAHDNPFNREVAGNLASYFATPTDLPPLLAQAVGTPENFSEDCIKRLQKSYTWEAITTAYKKLAILDTGRSPA